MRPHERMEAESHALTLKAMSTPSIFTLLSVKVPVLRALPPRTRAWIIAGTIALHLALIGMVLYLEQRPGPPAPPTVVIVGIVPNVQ